MSHPEITIDQGKLRGSVATNFDGEKYFSFQGIPYATPPVGELRFKAPLPPKKWNGTFDATKEGDACIHQDWITQIKSGSENCLILNVYTKKLSSKLSPVLFWIHGGGFVIGSSSTDMYGPDFLLIEDVVVVTINYRLGMLGFLSLEDPSLGVPGNAAFKDMVMALKWVQKNIDKFGGDPNNVTIFGESAGGIAVHLLCLSEMSKGLFHKAIAQSGCALISSSQGKKNVEDIAAAIGQNGADEKTIYKHLMEKSVEEIFEIQLKVRDSFRTFSYVIENPDNVPTFLTEEPMSILESGRYNHVPLMIGYTSKEGMIFDLFTNPQNSETPLYIIPYTFGYEYDSPEHRAAVQKVNFFYYGSEEPSSRNIEKKYEMLGDAVFVYNIHTAVLQQFKTAKAPIYMYRISVESKLNWFKHFLKITEPGTSHWDDVGYLFKAKHTPEIEPGSLEDIAIRRFVRLWTNFAKYGNPTPKTDDLLNVIWKPVQGPELDFLDIENNLTVSSKPEADRMAFWNKLYENSPAGKKAFK